MLEITEFTVIHSIMVAVGVPGRLEVNCFCGLRIQKQLYTVFLLNNFVVIVTVSVS